MSVISGPAFSQMVYDAISGAQFTTRTQSTTQEQADLVRLASIEHPITKIRFLVEFGGVSGNLRVAIYTPDPITGLPGTELLGNNQAFQPSGSGILDVEIPPLQLTEGEIWVAFAFTPSGPGVLAQNEPTLGASAFLMARKFPEGWDYVPYRNFAMQIFMTPK
jgi:hypothetical protein